jgi:hypothetical protein
MTTIVQYPERFVAGTHDFVSDEPMYRGQYQEPVFDVDTILNN